MQSLRTRSRQSELSVQSLGRFLSHAFALLLSLAVQAEPVTFDSELLGIQQSWAQANYQIADTDARKQSFEALTKRAAAFSSQYSNRAEPLVWEGIVLSTYAGVKGGLGALSLAKQAREKLLAAVKIDPNALDGSAYTSLGTLYHKVPGFPLGFGDDKKAREYLQQALKQNPDGLDPNYFYGEFLYDTGAYREAQAHLEKVLAAAPRPNREVADRGRKNEANALLARVKQKLG